MAFSFRWWTAVLLVCTIHCSTACTGESSPVVETRQGSVRGYKDEATNGREFFAFRGIPYAEPPVGPLRFKNPEPATSWKDTLDTINPGSPCVQYPFSDNIAGTWTQMFGQENCLFLNVFTPNIDVSTKKLAVMVFLHGGAWITGDASYYPANSLLAEDVVLVVVQYRIGTFGFLSTEDSIAPGNLGLKDQNLALKWVQQNIVNFGGNPEMVTIFGESVGGASVHFHLLTDHSQGLFHRAILQSGTASCMWATTDNARQNAYTIGKQLGCVPESEQVSSQQLIECLQGKSIQELANTYSIFFEFGILPFATGPIIDGEFLKAHPAVLMKEGDVSTVDMMTGVTRDDGAFVSSMVYSSEKMFADFNQHFDIFGPLLIGIPRNSFEPMTQVNAIYKRYFGQNINISSQVEEFNEMCSDRFFKIPNDNTALDYLEVIDGTDKRVFLYDFNYRGKQSFLNFSPMQYIEDSKIHKKWVGHGDDLVYLFPGSIIFKAHDNDADKEMTKRMVKLWTNFAATGNPTPDDKLGFVWEAAEKNRLRHLVIQQQPYMREDQRQAIRKFWNSLPLPDHILANPERFENVLKEMRKMNQEENESVIMSSDHEELKYRIKLFDNM